MQITNIRALAWSSKNKTSISAIVDIVGGVQDVPINVSDNYDLSWGRDFFADSISGKYGDIADYVPPPAPVISHEQVKSEANRRIVKVFPDWKQRNLLAEGLAIAQLPPSQRTDEQKARAKELNKIWEWIVSVRKVSDELEVMKPIPKNYTDDKYWP